MLSEAEMRQFEEAGAVTVNTPLSTREIAAASDA